MIHKYLVYFDGQIIPSLSCVSSYRLAQAFFCFISTISWAFLYFLPPKMFQAHLFFLHSNPTNTISHNLCSSVE